MPMPLRWHLPTETIPYKMHNLYINKFSLLRNSIPLFFRVCMCVCIENIVCMEEQWKRYKSNAFLFREFMSLLLVIRCKRAFVCYSREHAHGRLTLSSIRCDIFDQLLIFNYCPLWSVNVMYYWTGEKKTFQFLSIRKFSREYLPKSHVNTHCGISRAKDQTRVNKTKKSTLEYI